MVICISPCENKKVTVLEYSRSGWWGLYEEDWHLSGLDCSAVKSCTWQPQNKCNYEIIKFSSHKFPINRSKTLRSGSKKQQDLKGWGLSVALSVNTGRIDEPSNFTHFWAFAFASQVESHSSNLSPFCAKLLWRPLMVRNKLWESFGPNRWTFKFHSFLLLCRVVALYVHTYQGRNIRAHVPSLHRTYARTKATSYVWTYEVYIVRAHVRSTYEVAMAVCGDNEALHKLEDFLRWMLFDNETMSLQFKFIFCFSTLVFSSWIPVSRLAPFSEFALAAFAIGPELLLRPQSKYLRFG